MTCALPPVDMSVAVLGWHDGYFLPPRGEGAPLLHPGLDFMADVGSPVVAAYGGTVIYKGVQPYGDVLPGSPSRDGMGNYVVIAHGMLPRGFRPVVTVYGHLRSPSPLSIGQHVSTGDLVGYVGMTGRSERARQSYLFFKVMQQNESPSYDYKRGAALGPVRDFFAPLNVTQEGEQRPGPPVTPYVQTPGWGGVLVQNDACSTLSSISPSRQQSKYSRFGSTQLSSRAVYAPALYEGGSTGSSVGTLLGLAAVVGGILYISSRPKAPKAPPWWVRQQRWK